MKCETKPSAIGFLAGALFFLAALLAIQSACGATQKTKPLAVAEQDDAVVELRVLCFTFSGDTMKLTVSAGSGVVVSDKHVLTAYHVVKCDGGNAVVTLTEVGGKKRTAVVDKSFEKVDVSRLHVLGGIAARGVKHAAPPPLGAIVCSSTGYPERTRECGPLLDRGEALVWQGRAWFGNSGSPLYDGAGRLVGIVVGGWFVPNTAIPVGRAGATAMQARFLL